MRGAPSPAIRLVSLLTVCTMTFSACTSMHPVPSVSAAQPATTDPINLGDEIRVTMRDGRKASFVVQEVNSATIVARGGITYPHDEIVTIERRQFSGGRTAGLVAGLFGGALLIMAATLASASASLLAEG